MWMGSDQVMRTHPLAPSSNSFRSSSKFILSLNPWFSGLHTINVGKPFSKQNNWQQQTHRQTSKLLIEEKCWHHRGLWKRRLNLILQGGKTQYCKTWEMLQTQEEERSSWTRKSYMYLEISIAVVSESSQQHLLQGLGFRVSISWIQNLDGMTLNPNPYLDGMQNCINL